MQFKSIRLLSFLLLPLHFTHAQGTVPTFQHAVDQSTYTLVGHDPEHGGATTIPTVLVSITLAFESKKIAGKPFIMDATMDVPSVLR